jgi:deoxyribonuclease-4
MATQIKVPVVGHCMEFTTVTNALRLIHTMGGRAVQMSLGDGGSRQVQVITEEDALTAKRIISKGFYAVVHGKYLYNFCRPPSGIGWQHKLLQSELKQAAKIGADVIIHQGKNVKELGQTKDQAHQTFVDNLIVVLNATSDLNNHIILENSARQGTECGYTLDDLCDIYQRISDSHRKRISFCIDLCHIFVAGELDVRNVTKVRAWFQRFDKLIGLNKLVCIHFNDSDTEFNGANDNHGSIGRGYIGKQSTLGFEHVCKLAYKHDIPLILETSSEYIQSEIVQLKSWSLSS